LHARLTLLHVIQPLPSGVDVGVILPAGYMEDLEAGLNQSLQAYHDRVTQAGLQGEVVVEHGIPFKSIIDAATNRHVDMIVMGTQGRTGLQHLLLGSVAEKVVRLAPCAVLVVRHPTIEA
jgi:nucleotide-binding universal stress UspA family protein